MDKVWGNSLRLPLQRCYTVLESALPTTFPEVLHVTDESRKHQPTQICGTPFW